jgi:hypothetical protein
MNESFHPAVQLMLARMDTHPEEFRPRGYRWEEALGSMLEAASPEERLALNTQLNRFSMDALHEQIMSELLEGKSEDGRSPRDLELARRDYALHYLQYDTANPPPRVGSALKAIFK